MTGLATLVLTRVPPGTPGTERGEEFGKTSPIALVVILVLLLATVLLIRSMSKRLRNVPASFDDPTPGRDEPRGHGPASSERRPGTGSPRSETGSESRSETGPP